MLSLRLQALGPAATSGVAHALAADLAHWIRSILNFGPTTHVAFMTAAQDSVVAACQLALLRKYPLYEQDGFRPLYTRPPVVYLSAALASMAPYISQRLCLPRSSIAVVPNKKDGFAMSIEALQQMVDQDVHELRVPLLVVAAFGVSGSGQVDDLQDLAEFAAAAGIWLHAHGNSVAFRVEQGGEMYDSMSFDLACWLGLLRSPVCVVFKQLEEKETGALAQATCPLLDTLPLWIALRVHGLERVSSLVRHSLALTRAFATKVAAVPQLKLVTTSSHPLPSVSVVYDGRDSGTSDGGHEETFTVNEHMWARLASQFPELALRVSRTAGGVACMAYSPLETGPEPDVSVTRLDDMAAAVSLFFARLQQNREARAALLAAVEQHKLFRVVPAAGFMGLAAIQYVPPYASDHDAAALAEVSRVSRALVPVLQQAEAESPLVPGISWEFSEILGANSQWGIGVGFPSASVTAADAMSLLEAVAKLGKSVEDPTKLLDRLSQALQLGIQQAQESLNRESEARLFEEGLLRQVPLVSSVLNWLSPPARPAARPGRAFDLTSGTILQTCAEPAEQPLADPE